MDIRTVRLLAVFSLVVLGVLTIPSRLLHNVEATNTAPPPPPPPVVGQFGGPLAGLTSTRRCSSDCWTRCGIGFFFPW